MNRAHPAPPAWNTHARMYMLKGISTHSMPTHTYKRRAQLSPWLSPHPLLGESITATTFAAGGVKLSPANQGISTNISTHSQALQSPAVVCCLRACCKFPWTNPLNILPAPSCVSPSVCLSFSPSFLSVLVIHLFHYSLFAVELTLFAPNVNMGLFLFSVHVLHPIALPDCCNHVLEKAVRYLFSTIRHETQQLFFFSQCHQQGEQTQVIPLQTVLPSI